MWDVFRVSSDKLALCHLELMRKMNDLIRDINKYGEEQVKIHRKVRASSKRQRTRVHCPACLAPAWTPPDLPSARPLSAGSNSSAAQSNHSLLFSWKIAAFFPLKTDLCVIFVSPDEGGDGGDGGGRAGAAGSEQPPSEGEGGLSCQVFGAGPLEEGGRSSEGAGEGQSPSSPVFRSHLRPPESPSFPSSVPLSPLLPHQAELKSKKAAESFALCIEKHNRVGAEFEQKMSESSLVSHLHFLSLNPTANESDAFPHKWKPQPP